ASLSYLSPKETSSGGERAASTFDGLRAELRGTLAANPEGALRTVVSRQLNELGAGDSAIALAFVEFLIDKKPEELRAYLAALDADATVVAGLEQTMKASVEE